MTQCAMLHSSECYDVLQLGPRSRAWTSVQFCLSKISRCNPRTEELERGLQFNFGITHCSDTVIDLLQLQFSLILLVHWPAACSACET